MKKLNWLFLVLISIVLVFSCCCIGHSLSVGVRVQNSEITNIVPEKSIIRKPIMTIYPSPTGGIVKVKIVNVTDGEILSNNSAKLELRPEYTAVYCNPRPSPGKGDLLKIQVELWDDAGTSLLDSKEISYTW